MLSVKGMAITVGIMWGALILLVGGMNLVWPTYGVALLDIARSIYPGYANTAGFMGVLVGTGYSLIDGAVGGAIFAWLYNRFSGGVTVAQPQG